MTKERPRFDAVCFDCDSTLTRIEGIDELARRVGCAAEIAALTEAAMNGAVALEEVYAKRLDLVRPDRASLAWLAERYTDEMVSGAAETIATLRRHSKALYIVTSGLLQAVAGFVHSLGFGPSEVHAVEVHFDATGAYQGFHTSSPLCRSDGKAIICRKLAARYGAVAMVGDGVTDLAARAGGAYVVGYGGIVRRDAVIQGADCYFDAPSLTATLSALLSETEQAAYEARNQAMSTASKLRVRVVDDEIIVTLPGSRYSVIYYKPENSPQLLAKAIPDTDDLRIAMTVSEFLAKAWRLANDKAKEVGWIV